MLRADHPRRWRHALGFFGVEPLLHAYAAFCESEKVPFAYLNATPRRPWYSYLPVARWLWSVKPDVVILHSPTALPGVLPYLRANGVPLIVVEHQPNELKSRQEWLFSALSMHLADAIVTLTPQHQGELAARLGRRFRAEKAVMIPNGIDLEAFGPAAPFAMGGNVPVRIGMAARFSATKRFDLVIDMLSLLRQRDRHQWWLSLAGSGEQWEQVRSYAMTTGVEVAFEGMLTGKELADWYRSLDVYCHASDGETLSVSVLQAMASGLPIVGSDVEGISNLLAGDPPLGVLVGAQTAKGFASAVRSVAADSGKAKAMALLARTQAERLYDQRCMFSRYNDLVERLAGGRSYDA